MKRIKVAHIITRLCKGGAQENTFHSVRLANKERFSVDLISGPTRGREGSIEEAVRAAGIPIIREPFLVRAPMPLWDALALQRLTRLFRKEQYDIVHTHTSKAGFIGRIAAERAGVPMVVHTPHGNIFHGYFSAMMTRLFVWMERHAARRTDRIIELTPGGIEEHLEEGIGQRDQYRVIFSGVDTAPFEAALARREMNRQALGVGSDEILVGGVGRLEPVKGFVHFVAAARTLAEKDARLRFVQIGAGSQQEMLEKEAAPLGTKFKFLGLREDVPDLMAAMDLIVVPSINEGMGRVVLEAGAAGVPVVASAVGGIPDIVDAGETGLLVEPRDPEALANAVLELCAAPERRKWMGETARAKVVPHFSLESMVEQLETLYEELIDEKGRNPRR